MDGHGDYHTKWSMSGKDKCHIILLICTIFTKLYKWTYLQNRNKPFVLVNELLVTMKKRWRRGKDWDLWIDMYTLLYLKLTTNKDLLYITGNSAQYTAAAAAKSLQSCPTLCDPIEGSPPGSPAPGILQARALEWVAISFSNVWKWKVKVKSLSRVRLLATPWTAAHQAAPTMGFSKQEYWSGVPLPSPAQYTVMT